MNVMRENYEDVQGQYVLGNYRPHFLPEGENGIKKKKKIAVH